MRVIDSSTLTRETAPRSLEEKDWVYCAGDVGVTMEVWEVLAAQLDNQTTSTYRFACSLQAPILDMKLRGVLIDQDARASAIAGLEEKIDRLEGQLRRIVVEGVGLPDFNWRSTPQLKRLFYDIMGLPPQRKQGEVTVDRGALEKLSGYFYAQPLISHLQALRDLGKKLSFLRTEIDADGRMRTSYNIAGTTTGRLSSNISDFGSGTNLQNVNDELRVIVIADPGYKFAYIDLEQAESRAVGGIIWNRFSDGTYLDACESGDLHTQVTKMCWAEKPWTGDADDDKALAEQKFYRAMSFRDTSKRLGHGSNYGGQPPHMAKQTKIDLAIVKQFQARYFGAFTGIPTWHNWVSETLRTEGQLTSLTGRRRDFWGRRTEASTLREAIAYDPQGSVGDLLNEGMLRIWRAAPSLGVHLLLQIHDAVLVQYPAHLEDQILPELLHLITVPLPLAHNRQLIIPSEAQVGFNWAKWTAGNPDGLRKWKGPGSDVERKRERDPARVAGRRRWSFHQRPGQGPRSEAPS